MTNWGLKISRDGNDISSTEPTDFVFNSAYSDANTFIVSQGSGTATIAGSGTTQTTIAHSLGYIPMVMLYCELTPGSGNWEFGLTAYSSSQTVVQSDPSVTYVDDTNFKFRLDNLTGSQKIVKYYYFLLGDSAN